MKLAIKAAKSEDAKVTLVFQTPESGEAELVLSVTEVSALVSMLYRAQGDALKQQPENGPEMMLPIVSFQMGKSGQHAIFRAYVTEHIFQDYYAPEGSEMALAMEAFSTAVATQFDMEPIPFGHSKN